MFRRDFFQARTVGQGLNWRKNCQNWISVFADSDIYACFFHAAQRAFINTDNFFRIAGLIGLRADLFVATGFCAEAPRFCFAHLARCAAAILARAAALMCRGPR